VHPTSDLFYTSSNESQTVLDGLRSILNQHPQAATAGSETLAELLYERHFLPHQPETFEVQVALEALAVEGVILP
jgi:hypothetical protein